MSVGNTTVDQRIVEMRIDNEKFEAGAKKTIGILESLDRSLKGLGEENASGFDNIGKSLDKVTDRFSAMGIVGDQIMRNLTNKTMELVGQLKNMSTMLTTQQIGAGWDKYADKTQAIQTIMAATNKTIEEGRFADQAEQLEWVNEQIQKLNKFTDETSYNFLDMVGNIGKFTAAGRELEESVTAMEGIANWAAISGGRPAEASRAMYNLSQALGMGKVTQLDWKSIENANMATYEFKQQVIDVAEELGTLKKISDGIWVDMEDHEVTVESFRENLKDGWFDSDVLLKVLNRYGEFSDVLLDVSDATGKTATEILSQIKAYKETGRVADWLSPYIQNLTKDEYELGLRAFQAAQEAKTFTEAIEATKDAVSTKWMTVFELLFGNYLEAKELWTNMSEVFWDIFAGPVDHLIEIIEGAGGFFSENSIISGFAGGMEQAAGGTAILEDRLAAVGKTLDDFHKALNKTMGSKQVKQILNDYGSLEEALRNGAITADQFKKALGALDDAYNTAGTVSLNRALNKAGKSMTDFEKAIEKVGDRAALDLIENFGGVEEALKRGGISADLFKKALESLGIDSENVAETVEESVQTSVGSLAEMRQLALEVLRGDHGNGEERLKWYESLGLDAELMQAMAGDLKNMGYYLSDEALMAAMESYYQYNNLASRLGYATFAEYLASREQATEEYMYDMNAMADEADMIYASLFGEGVLDEYGDYISAGELFRKSLSNLLEALDKFGSAFDEAFMKVFGGSKEYDEQVANMSDGFFTLTAAFYSFTERIKAFSESEAFLNFATAMFSILRVIGKALGLIFKVAKIGLSFAMKLLSPILKLASGLFEIIATGIDTISRSIDELGIVDIISEFGNDIYEKIAKPIDKINYVISSLIQTFKAGFADGGGIIGGLRNMSNAIDQLFENHPVFLTVVHALGKALVFLKDAISGLALVLGSIFGGAVIAVISGLQKLGELFGRFVNWAKTSDVMVGIWTALTNAFVKFGNVVKRVWGYAEEGFAEGGFMGALSAVAASFERGVKRLIPGGEKLIEIFNAVKEAVRGLFKKKVVDENGVEKEIEDTEGALITLEETFGTRGGFFANLIRGASGDEEAKAEVEEGAAGLVESAWQGFLNGLRNIRISDVIDALKLGVIANVLLKVGHGLNIFNGLADSIGDIPDRLTDMMEDLGQMFRSLSFDIKANAVLKFAAAAGIIAGAIWLLSNIPSEKLEKASSVVIAILTVFALLAGALSKTSASIFQTIQYMPALGAALIGFAMTISSIGTAALILALVAKFVGVNELKVAANTVISILATMAVIIAGIILLIKGGQFNMERIRAIGSMLQSIGFGMIGIALAVQMLIIPVLAFCAILKFVRGNAGLGKFVLAVGAVIGLILAIGGFIAIIISAVQKMDDKSIITAGNLLMKVGIGMIGIALAVQMLIIPVAALAALQKYIGKEETYNAVLAVGGLIGYLSALTGIFAWFLNQAGYSNMQEIGKTLLRTAASMLIVVVAIRMLVKPITEIAELSAQVEDKFILRSILYLLGTITAIGLVLAALNRLGNFRSGDALIHIAGAIALLSFSMLLLTPAIILLTGAIALFTAVLAGMDDKQWETFEKGLTRLGKFSIALLKFGGALLIVGLAATLTGAGILSMSIGILAFAAALGIIIVALPKFIDTIKGLKDITSEEIWKNIKKIGLAIGGLLLILFLTTVAVSGLLRMLGGNGFKAIGAGIINTIKGIATGMRTGVRNGFTSVVEFLKDEKNKEAILAALETLILVGAAYVAGVLPTVAHVVVGGIVGLLNAVASEFRSQAPEIVDAISNIVGAILDLAKGLVAKLFGEESWSEMSWWQKGIADLGGGLLVINKVAGLFSFGKAEESAKTLSDKILGLAEGITDTKNRIGGMKDSFNETKAAVQLLVEAAGGLSVVLPVALALAAAVGYANHELNAQQDILRQNAGDPKSLDEYANSIAQVEARIAELTELEKSGWGTELSSQELGAQQVLLATLKKEYEDLKASQEESNVTTAETVEATHQLTDAELQRQEQLEARKRKSQEATAASQEEIAAINEEASAFDQLKEHYGSYTEMFGDIDIFDKIKEAVANQGVDINDLIKTDGSGLDVAKFKSMINVDKLKTDLSAQLNDVGMFIPEGIADGFPGGESYLTSALGGVKDTLLETLFSTLGIASPSTVMANEVGQYIPAGIGMGIDQNYYQAVNPLYRLTDEMRSVFTNVRSHFVSAGAQIVAGLIEGISNNMEYAYEVAKNLGLTVKNGFAESLRIESPSKVFSELARYIPLGIGQGIDQGTDSAISSVVVLSDALIDAIMQSMAMVSTVADDNFEFTPTITPVVDMSNVNSAAGFMGGMFGRTYSMSAQMSEAISRRMSDVERMASNMESNQTINNGDTITFNIYGAEGQDPNEIADAVMLRMQNLAVRRGAAFG